MMCRLNFKSGQHIITNLDLPISQMIKRIEGGEVDIDANNLSMIRWAEVESISPVKE